MPRTIEYIGEELEISDYTDVNRYDNQTEWVEGIPLNPVLRPDFDMTPNDVREDLEIADWWGKPFILAEEWAHETWEQYLARTAEYEDFKQNTKEEFDARLKAAKAGWLNEWPSGTRFSVRCLDGGAWDRSTCLTMVGTLEEALAVAKAQNPVPTI